MGLRLNIGNNDRNGIGYRFLFLFFSLVVVSIVKIYQTLLTVFLCYPNTSTPAVRRNFISVLGNQLTVLVNVAKHGL